MGEVVLEPDVEPGRQPRAELALGRPDGPDGGGARGAATRLARRVLLDVDGPVTCSGGRGQG